MLDHQRGTHPVSQGPFEMLGTQSWQEQPIERAAGTEKATRSKETGQQPSLTRRLMEARRAAKGASEEERAGQRYYKLLMSYEAAQAERSRTLRKLRRHPEERKAALEKHPLIYRNLRLLPSDVRQRILGHLKNGSFVADAAEAEKVHTSVIMAWLEKGFQAYLGDQEDPESVLYRELYLVCFNPSPRREQAPQRAFMLILR